MYLVVTTTQTHAESVTAQRRAGAMGTVNGGTALPVPTKVSNTSKNQNIKLYYLLLKSSHFYWRFYYLPSDSWYWKRGPYRHQQVQAHKGEEGPETGQQGIGFWFPEFNLRIDFFCKSKHLYTWVSKSQPLWTKEHFTLYLTAAWVVKAAWTLVC